MHVYAQIYIHILTFTITDGLAPGMVPPALMPQWCNQLSVRRSPRDMGQHAGDRACLACNHKQMYNPNCDYIVVRVLDYI